MSLIKINLKYGEHETGRSTYGSRFLIFRPNGRENIPLNRRWRVGVGRICARVLRVVLALKYTKSVL